MSFQAFTKFPLKSIIPKGMFSKIFFSTIKPSSKYQIRNYDVNPPQDFKYSYEDIKDNVEKSGKMVYKPQLSKKYRSQLTRKQFEDYKDLMRQKAEDEKAGIVRKIEVVEDEVWGQEIPVERKFDRIIQKEMYWISRDVNYYENSNRKIQYLNHFQAPFYVNNQETTEKIEEICKIIEKEKQNIMKRPFIDLNYEQFYKKNELVLKKIEEISNLLPHFPFQYLPNLGLAMAFQLKYKPYIEESQINFWKKFSQIIESNLHHYSLLDIAKLEWAMAGTKPKKGSKIFHKKCRDLVQQEIKNVNLNDVLHLYHSFRLNKRDQLYTFFLNELKTRKNEAIQFLGQNPDIIADIIYTYANCRIRNEDRKMIRVAKEFQVEADEFLNVFLDPLLNHFDNVSIEATTRLVLAFSLMRVENYQDVVMQIERKLIKNIDKLDSFQVFTILYGLSKFSEGRSEGKLELYKKLYPLVEKFWPNYSTLERARIFYAFTTRGFEASDFPLYESTILPWVKENLSNFTHTELSNILMGLMFLRNKDPEIWKGVIKNIAKQQLVVPMTHFFTFKMVLFYMKALFPTWNYRQYLQAMQWCEDYFNIMRTKKKEGSEEFMDLYKVLHFKFNVNVKPQLEWENLFVVDLTILPQKLGIFLQTKRESLPDSSTPRPIIQLKKYILENHGWGIYICDWEEYLRQGEQKDDWLYKTFSDVYKKHSTKWAEEESEKTIIERIKDKIDFLGKRFDENDKFDNESFADHLYDKALEDAEKFEVPEEDDHLDDKEVIKKYQKEILELKSKFIARKKAEKEAMTKETMAKK